MSGNLVDTNVIIKVLNGNNEAVELFDSLGEVYISVITVGELICLWIAATAIFDNYSLVTFDQHFKNISKLRLVGVDFFK
jgi:predicted nucleic acid-binding protein